jgi:hypothetical protein
MLLLLDVRHRNERGRCDHEVDGLSLPRLLARRWTLAQDRARHGVTRLFAGRPSDDEPRILQTF